MTLPAAILASLFASGKEYVLGKENTEEPHIHDQG